MAPSASTTLTSSPAFARHRLRSDTQPANAVLATVSRMPPSAVSVRSCAQRNPRHSACSHPFPACGVRTSMHAVLPKHART